MLNNLSGIALSVMLFCFIVGLGFVVMEKFQNVVGNTSTAYSHISEIISATGTLVSFLPVIIIVAVAAIVMALFGAFGWEPKAR